MKNLIKRYKGKGSKDYKYYAQDLSKYKDK
jgi:hypothetical protein